jgi:nucleotide-binding universal stress UspA family protein
MSASPQLQESSYAAPSVGFRKILIATDFSAYSNKALHYGLRLARRYHSEVEVVSIVSSLGYAMAGPEAVSIAIQLGKKDAEDLRARLSAGKFLDGITAKFVVNHALDVPAALLEACHQLQPDLVVVGTHGRTGFSKMWLGSVAENVFRASSCPVLTVGPVVEWPNPRTELRILFPTDFSPESVCALNGCVRYAQASDSGLMLLHVARVPHGEAAGTRQRIVAELENRLRDLLPDEIAAQTHVRVVFGDVCSAICSVAEEEQCSQIVMGLRHHKGLFAGRWEHAYQVVAQAACPVLTVRAIPK